MSPTPQGQQAQQGPMGMMGGGMPVFIQLVPGEGDTMESWFKVGGADAICDRLIADGAIRRPCVITTSHMEFMNQGQQMPGFKVNTLRASDYPTWTQRRRALVRLLLTASKEQPQMPMGGGFPQGGQRPQGMPRGQFPRGGQFGGGMPMGGGMPIGGGMPMGGPMQ